MASRIRRVSRFSTGTVDIHPQHAYRGRSPMYWWILTSRRWLEGRPINVYVIEHADGVVVFDTGQDRASVTDPSYFPDGANGVIYRRLAAVPRQPGRDVDRRPRTPGLPHQRRHPRGGQPSPPGPHRRHRRDTGSGTARLRRRVAIAASADGRRPAVCCARTSSCPTRSGSPSPTNPSTTRRCDPSPSVTTCSGTARSRSSPRPDTRRVPCRCSCAGATDLRCCSSETSPTTYTRSNVASPGGVGSKRALRDTRTKVMALRANHPAMPILAAHDPAAAGLLDAATAAREVASPV